MRCAVRAVLRCARCAVRAVLCALCCAVRAVLCAVRAVLCAVRAVRCVLIYGSDHLGNLEKLEQFDEFNYYCLELNELRYLKGSNYLAA